MSSIPDRVSADLRDHELRQERAQQRYDAHIRSAKEALRRRLFTADNSQCGPNVDTLLDVLFDDLPHAIGAEWQNFRTALAQEDGAELGRIMRVAAEAAAQRYIDGAEDWLENYIADIGDDE